MKKVLFILGLVLVFVMGVTATYAQVKNPDTFVLADIGSVETLDPAKVYDNAGAAKLYTIYQNLISSKIPIPINFHPFWLLRCPRWKTAAFPPTVEPTPLPFARV